MTEPDPKTVRRWLNKVAGGGPIADWPHYWPGSSSCSPGRGPNRSSCSHVLGASRRGAGIAAGAAGGRGPGAGASPGPCGPPPGSNRRKPLPEGRGRDTTSEGGIEVSN
jgi:hypothetical protein